MWHSNAMTEHDYKRRILELEKQNHKLASRKTSWRSSSVSRNTSSLVQVAKVTLVRASCSTKLKKSKRLLLSLKPKRLPIRVVKRSALSYLLIYRASA